MAFGDEVFEKLNTDITVRQERAEKDIKNIEETIKQMLKDLENMNIKDDGGLLSNFIQMNTKIKLDKTLKTLMQDDFKEETKNL